MWSFVFDILLTSQIFAVLLAGTSMETAKEEQLIVLQKGSNSEMPNV